MFKTVILGCENSHADAFLELIKNDSDFSAIEVIGVYSDETDRASRLSDLYGVYVMNDPAEKIGEVDGVIVTARHGANHMKYAKDYIKKGVSFFIDKPFTIDPAEGEELCALFEKNGCRYVGGSCLKHADHIKTLKAKHLADENGKTIGGMIRTPVDLKSPYGGFYFYAQHLVESLIEAFGSDVKSVIAKENSIGINVTFRYDGYDITGMFAEKNYVYFAVRHSEKGSFGGEFPVENPCFKAELAEFRDILTGTSDGANAEEMLRPVYIMNAIENSIANGGAETEVK